MGNTEVLETYILKPTVLLDKQTKKQVCLTNTPLSGPLLDFQKPHACLRMQLPPILQGMPSC